MAAKLNITVHNASNLRAADWQIMGGKSDPYVKIRIPGKPKSEVQTKVIKKTLDPEWNEHLEIKDFRPGEDGLVLEVFDYDFGKDDDFLGNVELLSDELQHGFEGELVLDDPQLPQDQKPILRVTIAVEATGLPDAMSEEEQIQMALALSQMDTEPLDSSMQSTGSGRPSRQGSKSSTLPSGTISNSNAYPTLPPAFPPTGTTAASNAYSNLPPTGTIAASNAYSNLPPTETISGSRAYGTLPPTGTLATSNAFGSSTLLPTGTLPPQIPAASTPAAQLAGSVRYSSAFQSQRSALQSGSGISTAARIRVSIISAKDLRNADWIGKSDPYCTCKVLGKKQVVFETEVVDNCLDPVWNKTHEFDYSPGDDFQFSIFDKDFDLKGDDVLGDAVLKSEQFYPRGFEGDLQVEGGTGTLQVKVDILPATQAIQEEGLRSTAPSYPSMEQRRICVTVHGVRGLPQESNNAGSGLYCIGGIEGKMYGQFRTRVSQSGRGPVWNHEEEIRDYMVGEHLEFSVMEQVGLRNTGTTSGQGGCIGSAILTCEQFYPFGFNAEITISAPGQGIGGLLKVKVVVPDEKKDSLPSRQTTLLERSSLGQSFSSSTRVEKPLSIRGSATSLSTLSDPQRPALLGREDYLAPRVVQPERSYVPPASSSSWQSRSASYVPNPSLPAGCQPLGDPSSSSRGFMRTSALNAGVTRTGDLFSQIDRNKDGVITRDEFELARRRGQVQTRSAATFSPFAQPLVPSSAGNGIVQPLSRTASPSPLLSSRTRLQANANTYSPQPYTDMRSPMRFGMAGYPFDARRSY